MTSGLITAQDLVLGTAKTDGQVGIPLAPGISLSGTWTPSDSSNILIVTRSEAEATEYYKVPIPLPHRTTALKGVKLKSITVSYTIATADTETDDLEFQILKQTVPANGVAATGAIMAGDADTDYDAAHDTNAERLTEGIHTTTVTIPTDEQAYVADGEQHWMRVKVVDASTGNLALAITGAVANYDVLMF
jgi:hypothetical protein